jgi:hypothetical protein
MWCRDYHIKNDRQAFLLLSRAGFGQNESRKCARGPINQESVLCWVFALSSGLISLYTLTDYKLYMIQRCGPAAKFSSHMPPQFGMQPVEINWMQNSIPRSHDVIVWCAHT